jgi:predicted negative regulator of RcsB-dependent stress response
MSYKSHQKEIQAPDELQKLGQQTVPWMEQHGKTMVFGVLGAVAVGLIGTLVSHFSQKKEVASSYEFGGALKVLEREVNAAGGEAKPGSEAPFRTEQEKDEALVARLTEFRTKNSGRKAAFSAALPLAQALLRQKKPGEALTLLDEYLQKGDLADPFRPLAYEARGYALESQKKYDDALAAFDLLSRENKTDFMKGMGLYHRGRVLMLKGDVPGAAKQFADIEGAAPGSAAARLAKERIALLAAQGVAIPQTAAKVTLDAGH